MQSRMAKRLQKEYESLSKNNETFQAELVNNDLKTWVVSFEGAKETIYSGEKFKLQLRFSDQYVLLATCSPSNHPKLSSSASLQTTSISIPMGSSVCRFSTMVTRAAMQNGVPP